MIRVGDLNAALDFFCTKLGLVEVRRYDNDKARFSLIFLAAPHDLDKAKESQAPLVELTHNWDEDEYSGGRNFGHLAYRCLLYTSPSPRDQRGSRMPSSA